MVMEAFTDQVCVAFVGVFYTWCCLLFLYCGSPSYPTGALRIWVLSNCAPATSQTNNMLVDKKKFGFTTSPSSAEVSAAETTLSSLTRIQQKQKEIQIYFESSNFTKCSPSSPQKIRSIYLTTAISVQTGMDRCGPSSAVPRKTTPALKLFVNSSTLRLSLD